MTPQALNQPDFIGLLFAGILLKETAASALIIFLYTDSILRTTLLICGGKIKIISLKFISVKSFNPTWTIIRPKTELKHSSKDQAI